MHLSGIDYTIIGAYLLISIIIAAIFIKRANKGLDEFFASGRSLPWWLLGTSMVATTFSTDTPNLVTNLVREHGVANNWVWWAFLVTGMLTVFFYARLWRRSQVLTDLEFYEIRYSGKSAALVRGFRAVYLGLFFNCVIMASVTLAATKIANIMFGWSRMEAVIFCVTTSILYSVLSGLWGVVVNDFIQFIMAMTGSITAAYFALKQPEVGGLSGLVAKIDVNTLRLVPDFGNWELTLSLLIIPLAIQWWSVWYPGAEPGGGSYIAQRMLAAKDEKHSLFATLLFNIAHYGLRPWPWILVALASLLVYPNLQDIQAAFPHIRGDLVGHDIAYPAMLKFLPAGFLGIMVASLMAAYHSTMETHLNWGASYLVHDFYRRFINPSAKERHYVLISRLVTAYLMIVAGLVSFLLVTARESFDLMLSIGAGTGLIYLLRWFWWRINAWSEISAMISSFFVAITIFVLRKSGLAIPTHIALIVSVFFTTIVWLTVTLLTQPTNQATLINFYRLVRPFGKGWERIRQQVGVPASPDSLPHALLAWFLAIFLVYSVLFSIGNFLYGKFIVASVWLIPLLISLLGLIRLLPKILKSSEVVTERELQFEQRAATPPIQEQIGFHWGAFFLTPLWLLARRRLAWGALAVLWLFAGGYLFTLGIGFKLSYFLLSVGFMIYFGLHGYRLVRQTYSGLDDKKLLEKERGWRIAGIMIGIFFLVPLGIFSLIF